MLTFILYSLLVLIYIFIGIMSYKSYLYRKRENINNNNKITDNILLLESILAYKDNISYLGDLFYIKTDLCWITIHCFDSILNDLNGFKIFSLMLGKITPAEYKIKSSKIKSSVNNIHNILILSNDLYIFTNNRKHKELEYKRKKLFYDVLSHLYDYRANQIIFDRKRKLKQLKFK